MNIAAKRYPCLKSYINIILGGLDSSLFTESIRCSSPPDTIINPLPQPKVRHFTGNNATRMTNLALELARIKRERHDKVEFFFLANDSATIATEVPVYLLPDELAPFGLSADIPLTGHIDILQVRGNKVHIMDYKPGARTEKPALVQLLLYAIALGVRAKIDLKDIVCAYFDGNDYYQFIPNALD